MSFPIDLVKPLPEKPRVADPVDVERQYRYWQKRILISTIIGYALFYFVRKNFSIAMPMMEESLGITKKDLGLFLTMHGLLYGLSKLINGMVATG
jgi:OPA family glycerol-3-phosphate transporter-like MFS transporter/OPA family sugar phosphate sensor protein UhpC-like MFS transporter